MGFFESFLGVGGGLVGGVGGGATGFAVGGGAGVLTSGGILAPPEAVVGAGVGLYYGTKGGYALGSSAGRAIDQKIHDWTHAQKQADQLSSGDQTRCAGQCAANQKTDDLEKRANVKQETKGKTKHGRLPGTMADADREFDNLDPENVKNINTQYGPGRTGTLDDGNRVVVRPGNSGNLTEPSLDIQRPSGRNTEIRFGP